MAPVLRALAAAMLVAGPAYAQIQIPSESPRHATSAISFEVVSVKADPARSRSEAGPPTLVMHPSGRFTAVNVTVHAAETSVAELRRRHLPLLLATAAAITQEWANLASLPVPDPLAPT